MCVEYDEYLKKHDAYVRKAYHWIKKSAPSILKGDVDYMWHINFHDDTKTIPDEYNAYSEYMFGKKTKYTEQNYRLARLAHIHRNPHHWQHWLLVTDDMGLIVTEMPYEYIVEMVCSWWAHSWAIDDLFSIFDYYNDHKTKIKLHKKSRDNLEFILKTLEEKIIKVRGPREE